MTTTERMRVASPQTLEYTPGEPWYAGESGYDWYDAAADLAVERLGPGGGRACLVIGSPDPEVRRLWKAGWTVDYIDCREPPEDPGIGGAVVIGDATALPFASDRFDAVSSTCVLCHAGLGRYGDPVKPNGDVSALIEIARVLKPGGLAVLMVGPAVPNLPRSVVYGNVHRVYRPEDVRDMVFNVGLDMLDWLLWDGERWQPIDTEPLITNGQVRYHYLSVVLRKPT